VVEKLRGVRVIALPTIAVLDVVDARAEVGLDQPAHQPELPGQPAGGIVSVRASSAGRHVEHVRQGVGIDQATPDKSIQVTLRPATVPDDRRVDSRRESQFVEPVE